MVRERTIFVVFLRLTTSQSLWEVSARRVGEPVVHQYFAFGGKHTLGMKLHAAEVEGAVAQSHESAVGSCSDGFEHGGEAVGRNAPRVIASHSEGIGQPGKQIVRCSGKAGRGDTVAHLRKLVQTRTEDFGNGLMTEADAEDGFAAGVGADDVEQETGLARQSRAGGKQDFVVCFQLLEEKAVVSHDTDFCAEATEEMDEIVDKRIVVVDNNNFHKQEKGMSGGSGARFLTAGSA